MLPINGFASPKYENRYDPAGVTGSIVLEEFRGSDRHVSISMGDPPCDVHNTIPGETVGSQPLELGGWVRIGPHRGPDIVLEPVHGQESLLQP